jgi:GrpB-like predicted nucleotidyltransferase (UPF0157 family)/nitrite reductase/ring-hydroxylating ferredoxin subunit
VDANLAERLRAAGVDPAAPGDPGEAWRRLNDRFGLRTTLLDRYALEAAARGVAEEDLDLDLRERLAIEVLEARDPRFEFIPSSGRAVHDPVEVVDYDPAWPARFDTWRERLSGELGAVALRIEHVGSTSVPGLAAKPVIDVQVSVGDMTDEAAYVPAIERAGVRFRSRDAEHRYFRPPGDRPRVVQVHVCSAGSAWERRHLLFRDFLRADVATRDAYAALKRELASRYRDDRIAYNEGKSGFILDALERAAAWAARGERSGAARPATRFARILPADRLRDGELLPVEIDGTPIVLVRHLGSFYATANNCTHQDFPLSEAGFDPRDGVLVCAWHQACFDVRTGAAVVPPATEAVETFPVEVDADGWVRVALTGSLAR